MPDNVPGNMRDKLTLRMWLVFVVLVFAGEISAQEIVKWVDENGKVHYGDKVPEQYQAAAEVVKTDISVVSPEVDVRNANEQHVQQLRREDAKEEKVEARKTLKREQAQAKKQRAGANSQKSHALTREECRDRYVQRVAHRTECFKRAEEHEQGSD